MLADDAADLWDIDPEVPAGLARSLASLLSEEETVRCRRFRAEDRPAFAVAHGALRLILGGYLGVGPAEVRLRAGRWGKPEVDGQPLRFSLSHTRGAVMVAVTGTRDIGVDVERGRAGQLTAALARRFFTTAEAAIVDAASPAERPAVFLRLWTRKEACLKAAGTRLTAGIGLPVIAPAAAGQLLVMDPSGQLPGPWAVRDIDMHRGYAAAVALAGSAPFRVVRQRWRPADDGSVGDSRPAYADGLREVA
jgi:4'-phosphopantetheinyl transferase